MSVVYKREGGTPEESWNALIQQVNDLAGECGFGTLAKTESPHRWSKADIKEVQEKLKEICDDNEFDEIPNIWKQSIIDEFTEAIENGCCECSREPVLLDPAKFPYTSDTNGISGGTDGLVFLRELNKHDLPFDETESYKPVLDDINAESQSLRDDIESVKEEIEQEENSADPDESLLESLREELSELNEELQKFNTKGRHFWAITGQFDTGVGQGTRFGVIEKDGFLRDPEVLGDAQPGSAGLLGVNGGRTYQFVAFCQDFETLIASGGATFFNGDPPENFGALLPDWRTLTSDE